MYLREQDLVSFLNNYMQFYGGLSGKLERNIKVGKKYDRFLMFMIRSGQLICWANLIIMIRKPARPILITSMLENPKELLPWETFTFSIPHILVWWTTWANMHFYAVHLIMYICGTIATIGALEEIPQTDRIAIYNFAKTYRSLQVLRVQFDLASGPLLAAHKVVFVLVVIRSMYGAFTTAGEVGIFQGIVGSCGWLYVQIAFKTFGRMHGTCAEMLSAWGRLRDPWFRRVLKSCPKLKVEIAGLYSVDRNLSLTLAHTVINSIVSMILANN